MILISYISLRRFKLLFPDLLTVYYLLWFKLSPSLFD